MALLRRVGETYRRVKSRSTTPSQQESSPQAAFTRSINSNDCIKTLCRTISQFCTTAKMSRFFHGSESSSDSSSEEEESLYGSDAEAEEKSESESSSEESDAENDSDESSDEEGGKTGANRFLREASDDSEDSDEEDKVTIVKSAKDKRFDELEGTIRLIENAEKINDWGVISERMCIGRLTLKALLREVQSSTN